MKKILLLVFVLIMSVPLLKAESDGYKLQFCGDVNRWGYLSNQNKSTYRCYIHIPEEIATEMSGTQLTHISFSTTTDFSTTRDGKVFVTENFDNADEASAECKVINCYVQGKGGGDYFQTVELDEPYTIKAGQGFYFGYQISTARYSPNAQKYDYPLGVDDLPANDFAGYVDILDENGELLSSWDMKQQLKTNLFLSATVTGQFSGFDDLCSLGDATYGGDFSLPVKEIGDTAPIYFPIQNLGTKTITSLEYSISINGRESAVNTLALDIAPKVEEYIEIPAPEYVEGRNNVTIKVLKINNKEISGITSRVSCVVPGASSYDRVFVVEEGTGTWCGYCPRGIVGLEYMTDKYKDSFIGIAVHYNDNMMVESYSPIFDLFTGYPTCIVNRDPHFLADPSKDKLEDMYAEWLTQGTIGKVSMIVTADDKTLEVKTETTFAYDEEDASYSLAFVILEDGIVASQSNYFSGTESLEWWQDQPSKVDWTFEHTARDIFNFSGIAGSVPSSIKAGEPMSFTTTLESPNVKNIGMTSVVALLIDGATGTILNAAKVEAKDYKDFTAVEGIDDDNETVDYYNINGMRTDNPAKGSLLIRRQGAKISKILY